MEKSAQHLSVRSDFIMLLLVILIAVAHYSRSNGLRAARPLQKKGVVTSATCDNKEIIGDGSPSRMLQLIMMD
jgi:hypothetical protein